MQADSEKLRQAWIKAVQNSIATAFRDKGDDSEVTDTLPAPVTDFQSIQKVPDPLLNPSRVPPEAGQEVVHVDRKPGLWRRAQGEVSEGGERPAEGPGHPREQRLLRLWPAGPPLGQHQPGHHPLHTVLWNSQVGQLPWRNGYLLSA